MRLLRTLRLGRLAAALALPGALLLGATPLAAPPAAAAGGAVLFGAKVGSPTVLADFEAKAGRKLGVVRVYDHWDTNFPSGWTRWLKDHGYGVSVSVNPVVGGTVVPWRSIAGAQPGSAVHANMVNRARAVRAFGAPVYFTFHHEPNQLVNQTLGYGTSADFVAAYRKLVGIFKAQGATNAKFVWTVTGSSFTAPADDFRYAPKWYPGDDVVDLVGADGYNWYTCLARGQATKRPWTSFASIFEGARKFSSAHAKGLVVNEWGSTEDPAQPGRKGRWFAEAAATVKSPGWEHLRALAYYDSGSGSCDWHVATSATSVAGFKSMGLDAHFGAFGL